MTRTQRLVVGLSAVVLTCSRSAAHDSFLVAETAALPKPGLVRAAFVTMDRFPIGEAPNQPRRVAEWLVACGNRRQKAPSFTLQGNELVARVELPEKGIHVLAVALHEKSIDLPLRVFAEYLADEQAYDALRLLRTGLGRSPQCESYTKYGKTFVEVGHGAGDYTPIAVGHRLEIVPLTNPCRWRKNEVVAVRVLLDGRPAKDVRVSSGHEGAGPHDFAEHVRTDAKGESRMKFPRPGLWFLRVHSIHPSTAADRAGGIKADWVSAWASMTFRVSPRE